MLVLEMRSVSKCYRKRRPPSVFALRDVSFSVAEGEFIALCGPSGSGKTTLLSLLGALERPSQGEILFRGRDLAAASDVELARVRRRLGIVFQDAALLPKLSAAENVAYPLIPRGGNRESRYRTALRWLERLGLAEQAEKRPDELSGGERQRVAVARALAGDPEVFLADEPTSNLDAETSRRVIELLCELPRNGKTLIVATHAPNLLALAGRALTLQNGKLQV